MDTNQEQKHSENAPNQNLTQDWQTTSRKESGGTMAEADGVRSDLAVKPYYQSEDVVARANKSAQKQMPLREGRPAEVEQQANVRSRSQDGDKKYMQPQKKGLFNRLFGKVSKNEAKQRNKMSTKNIKLPKNFAELVLDLELLIDSGNFDIETVNKLMQLYSQAVEYYSGINDVRYVYYTERIQNMLVRPEILRLMKDGKTYEDDTKESALEKARKARGNFKHTRTLGPGQLAKLDQNQNQSAKKKGGKQIVEQLTKDQQEEQQKRILEIQKQKRKMRNDQFLEQAPEVKKNVEEHEDSARQNNVEYQNDLVEIESQKKKAEDVIKIIRTDENDQKSDIQRRIAERKQRLAMNRSVNAGEMKPQFGLKYKNKSFISIEKGFVPKFGDPNRGNVTPDRLQNKSDNSSIRLAAQQQHSANSQDFNQATKGSSTTLIDAQIKDLKHTQEEDTQDKPRDLLNRRKSGAQTIILKSNNPFDMQGNNVSVNFDIQSKSSAVFFNEDELQEFEENFQLRIQEVWTTIEQKQEQLQQDYQTKLEQIYEEVTQIKFEKIAEVKQSYKDDQEAVAKMEEEIQNIKKETETLKKEKIAQVQQELDSKKKEIQNQKTQMLSQIKNDLKQQKEMQNQQDQRDLNQAFDFINMDDGFDPESQSPGFGANTQNSKLEKQEMSASPDKDPAADREKYKAPEIKKNSDLNKAKGFDKLQAEDQDIDDDFDQAPRQRTFTFSKALGDERSESIESPQKTDEVDGDIDARKEQLKKELMSLQGPDDKQ